MHLRKRVILLAGLVLGLGALLVPLAAANSVGKITFEPSQGYTATDINGQNGWSKLNPAYDVKVATVASFPAAAHYHFGTQALRMSDAYTQGSFGDQTFSPGVDPAGETALRRFSSTFDIGSTLATEQSGMHVSVSPDDGNGGRMSYLRFEDMPNGIHVFFDDATNPGPLGAETSFNETDIATLSRNKAHSIKFSIQFKTGPANDKVKIFIDGKKRITGTTWEDYYRYDSEQIGNGNVVPTTSKMLFRESGTANPADANFGFLVDGLSLSSSNHGHH